MNNMEVRNALAAHLCDEWDDEFRPIYKAHWPEDDNDEGKREGGYVAIQPKHVQVRALEMADRILALLDDAAHYATEVTDAATPVRVRRRHRRE